MTVQLTFDELAALMKTRAGIPVDPEQMRNSPDVTFAEFGLDSLGLLGIVGELENRLGVPLPNDAERCRTPQEFIELVSSTLAKTGA